MLTRALQGIALITNKKNINNSIVNYNAKEQNAFLKKQVLSIFLNTLIFLALRISAGRLLVREHV